MARVKLTVRKHVHAPPRRNVVPMESHSDGQRAGYFPRTLQTLHRHRIMDSMLQFWLKRGYDRTKHCQKMKQRQRQRARLASMGRKRDTA
jgi:hypothetical protein